MHKLLKNELNHPSHLTFKPSSFLSAIPFDNPPPCAEPPPPFNANEREMLKMFLWYDLYIYLSKTINVSCKEDDMFNPKIIRLLLLDLMKDDEHTLEGIGYATHIPEDVLNDIVFEINSNPSVSVTAKIIEYYIIVKRHEYTEFIRRIFQLVEYNRC